MIAACEPLRLEFIERLKVVDEVYYAPEGYRNLADQFQYITGVQVLVTRNKTQVDEELLRHLPELKCVVVYGAGREHLDLGALQARDIRLLRCSEATAHAVAEFTLGLALCLSRRILEARDHVIDGKWNHNDLVGTDLRDKTVFVVGCGPIGTAVAKLFSAFGSRVIVFRESTQKLPEELSQLGCQYIGFSDGIAKADMITLHVPGGSATENLIGVDEISTMKESALLINTSRGSVVDYHEIITAVEKGQIAGAALDVLPEEPPKGQLSGSPRILYTPHLALYSHEAIQKRMDVLVKDISAILQRNM